MSTNEFDWLIAKKVSNISYEYDTSDWEKLTIQLAAARGKKRAVVFAYLSSGIAASVTIFLIVAVMFSKKGAPAAQYASKTRTPQPAPSALSVNNGINMQLPGAQHIGNYNSSVVISHKKQKHLAPDTITYNIPAVAYNNLPVNTSRQPTKKQVDTSGLEQQIRQHGYEEPVTLTDIETEKKSDHRRMNISLAGGINLGTVNTEYAIGAAVDKKLSKKFGVEVTVAYVGNAASTSGGQYPSSPFIPGGYFPPTKPLIIVTSPLNYLQFAPMADYNLSKKITLSAGADLQRLLQEQGVTVLYSDNAKVAPPIDIGMLLRTEYSMSSHLKAGLSYRLGANNLVAPGNNYFDRNYMQVQLKYKLH